MSAALTWNGRALNLPPTWGKMSWLNQAAYLCGSHQARDFAEARIILKGIAGPKRRAAVQVYTPTTRRIRLPYADA